MNQSRRQFVLSSTAAGALLLAGCVDSNSDDDSSGSGTGGNGTDEGEDGDESCDPLALPLVDEPPHGPTQPSRPDNIEEEDEWNEQYLGDGMDDESAVSFEQINLRFEEHPIDIIDFEGDAAYSAQLITSREEFDERFQTIGDESTSRANDIDFEEEAVVVVLSGFGSSSVHHEWVRIDENCEELHLHGYYTQPVIQTHDYTTRVSGVVVDKPTDYDLERAWVSLTVSENRRVNFSTDDDVQAISVDGTGDNDESDDGSDDDDYHGAIDGLETVPATRESDGDWYSDQNDERGIVVQLADESELRALTEDHEEIDRFIDGTDFAEDSVFYLESAGPNGCYRRIDVSNVVPIAETGGYFVSGDADVIDDQEDGACIEVITFPGVLIRVESDIEFSYGRFRITDGWEREQSVQSISMDELAME